VEERDDEWEWWRNGRGSETLLDSLWRIVVSPPPPPPEEGYAADPPVFKLVGLVTIVVGDIDAVGSPDPRLPPKPNPEPNLPAPTVATPIADVSLDLRL